MPSGGRFSTTIPAIPSLPSLTAAFPPTLDSLMPPVRGLLAPTESLPEFAHVDPESSPVATTSLFFGPSGWQRGGTSLATMLDVRPLPPKDAYSPVSSSVLQAPVFISTRINFLITVPPSVEMDWPKRAYVFITDWETAISHHKNRGNSGCLSRENTKNR